MGFLRRASPAIIVSCVCSAAFAQTVRTVAPSAGTGVWASPFATVQAALAVSAVGDEVWVKTGSFTAPTTGYALPSGVLLRGGFAGTEQVIADRSADPTQFITTLNGGGKTTIIATNSGATTLLDRFTLTGAIAANADGNGGAIRMTNSSLAIRDCVFNQNASLHGPVSQTWTSWVGGDGGAIWMTGSTPALERCTFTSNTAGAGNGGGCGSGTTAPPQRGGLGGAVAMVNSSATFTTCTFNNNVAGTGGNGWGCAATGPSAGGPGGAGGAVSGTNSSATFTDCSFASNRGGPGGNSGTWGGTGLLGGLGGAGGAAAFSGGGSVAFNHCVFTGNLAGGSGASGLGAADIGKTTATTGAGGALSASSLTNLSVVRCRFENNTAGTGGAASVAASIASTGGAGGSGGALVLTTTPATIANSLFDRNTPGNGGAGSTSPAGHGGAAGSGAIVISGSPSLVSIVNITSTANSAGTPGSGAPTGEATTCSDLVATGVPAGSVVVRNSILWEGLAPSMPVFTGTADFAYCLMTGASGPGVAAIDPKFTNPGAADFTLAARSPGIDAGDNTAAGVSDPDLTGNARFHDDTGTANSGVSGGAGGAIVIDIGPYEFQGTTPPCAADYDHSGALSVADIFTFLNLWFAGDPSADFDGANGLQVADIFAFLNAWFVGC